MPFDQAQWQPEPTDEVLQRLISGRAKIAKGWCQHALRIGGPGGPVCARGALFAAELPTIVVCWPEDLWDETAKRTERALAAQLPSDWHPAWRGESAVVYFNNDERTTQDDMLALFDRAISARRSELAAASELTRAA